MWSRAGLNVSGNTVGAEARFTVETFSAGRGDLDITVINPDGRQEKVRNCDLPLHEPLCLSVGTTGPLSDMAGIRPIFPQIIPDYIGSLEYLRKEEPLEVADARFLFIYSSDVLPVSQPTVKG